MTAVMTDMNSMHGTRWLRPVLFGSLALNLVVIGAAGALLWHSQFGTPEELGRRVIPSIVSYAVTLPPERVKELEQKTQVEWEKVRPARRALVEAREEWMKVLNTEPFDRQRLVSVQAKLVEADLRYREAAFKLHFALGTYLTPEERRGFARWREEQRRGRPPNPVDIPTGSGTETPR